MKKIPYISIILVCLFLSCKHQKQPADEANHPVDSLIHVTKAQFDNMKMQTGSLQEQEFNDEVKARGTADVPPKSKAMVSPVVSGSVRDIFIQPGERVQKGQALLSFGGPEIIGLQQSYLEISEQLKFLESEYKRQKTLFDEKITSEKLFLESESNYKKGVASCEGLRQQLLLLNIDTEKVKQGKISPSAVIYAPISGDIIKIHADINKVIQPADIVVEIIDTKQLQLYLSVFEKDILSIKPGQKVIYTLPETSQLTFTATVNSVGKAIEGSDRSATVQALPADSARQSLLAGMYIDAGIIINSRKVWAISVDALITEGENNYLLLLQSPDNNEYTFRKVKVQTGNRSGDFMEIIPDENVTTTSVLLVKGVYDIQT